MWLGDAGGLQGPAGVWLSQMSLAEAQSFGLLDPKLCYLLDGFLFLYGIVITALFLRAKVGAGVLP